ncbi:MAG: hypothetical protein PHN74_03035 [Candidatus Pacebacteria bacterium]|nr:hypothetical protein [Candidatus Paceibacterota bacterium]
MNEKPGETEQLSAEEVEQQEQEFTAAMETILALVSNKTKTIVTIRELKKTDFKRGYYEQYESCRWTFSPKDVTWKWLKGVAVRLYLQLEKLGLKPEIVYDESKVDHKATGLDTIADMVQSFNKKDDNATGFGIQITIEK